MKNDFSASISHSVSKPEHGWKQHFRGTLREVIAFLDYLAAKRTDRFAFPSVAVIMKRRRYLKCGGSRPLKERMVWRCIQFLCDKGILTPAVREVPEGSGKLHHGWFVARHEDMASIIGDSCIVNAIAPTIALTIALSSKQNSESDAEFFDGNEQSQQELRENERHAIAPFQVSSLYSLSSLKIKHDTAIPENREDSRNVFLNSSPPDERNPIDVLTTAARALTAEYGDIGTNLAAYIAAHCLNGTGIFPETTSYYMTSAERCYADDSGGWVAENGYDGRIYDFMLEDAPERLRRAIQNNTGKDADSILRALDEQRKRMGVPDEDAA